MATTQKASAFELDSGSFVNLADHEANMKRRQVEIDKNAKVLEECLNPVAAAKYENKKPHYLWKVTATFRVKNKEGDWKPETKTRENIMAQNEADAWSQFCDALQTWPDPKRAKREIVRGDRVPVETVMAVNYSPKFQNDWK